MSTSKQVTNVQVHTNEDDELVDGEHYDDHNDVSIDLIDERLYLGKLIYIDLFYSVVACGTKRNLGF